MTRPGSGGSVLCAALATLTVIEGCGGSSPTPPIEDEFLPGLLFHAAYSNSAWVPVGDAIYIDNRGNVWRMTGAPSSSPEVPALFEGRQDSTRYPAAELQARYEGLRDTVLAVVDPGDLSEKVALIREAARGPYSPAAQAGADIGTTLLWCFLYDADTATYRRIVLGVTGDWRIDNLSPAAKELASWLMQLWVGSVHPSASPA